MRPPPTATAPRDDILHEAIAQYLDARAWQTERIETGLADIREGRTRPVEEVFADIAAKHAGSFEDHRRGRGRADDPAAAEAVFQRIVASVDLLRSNPELGKPGRHPGTRELLVGRLPYVIVYTAGHDVLKIAAILHTARDLPRAVRARLKGAEQMP